MPIKMDADEVRQFESYYHAYTVDQLAALLADENSGLRAETKQAIKNLIQQKGGSLDVVLQNYYRDHSTQELFELLLEKEKVLDGDAVKAIKSNIDTNEGSLEKFIEKETAKSGEVLSAFKNVKKVNISVDYIEGILYLTGKKIFFIPQLIKYSQNTTIVAAVSLAFAGIGAAILQEYKDVGYILGSALGAGFGWSLCGAFDYFFNKPKEVVQHDIPLTLQAAYIADSFQVDLISIGEVIIGEKDGHIIITSEKKMVVRFEIGKERMDEVFSFLEKNGIKNRPRGSIITEFKNLKK